jgi:hypothetical protein
MTSKLLIKTYSKAEGYSEENLVAGKHLLSLKNFQELFFEEGEIGFGFEDGSYCILYADVQGNEQTATKLIRSALVANPGGNVELDLFAAGYEINDIDFNPFFPFPS